MLSIYDDTTDDMTSRSVERIILIPNNDQGSYYFIYLRTGKRIHTIQWMELHVTYGVFRRVEELDDKEGIHEMVNGEPLFE